VLRKGGGPDGYQMEPIWSAARARSAAGAHEVSFGYGKVLDVLQQRITRGAQRAIQSRWSHLA
jgi:hypothetical protein